MGQPSLQQLGASKSLILLKGKEMVEILAFLNMVSNKSSFKTYLLKSFGLGMSSLWGALGLSLSSLALQLDI